MRMTVGFLFVLELACSRGDGVAPTWRDALARLAGGNALYSWRFYGEDGPAYFSVGISTQDREQACSRYASIGNDPTSDYWVLTLDFVGSSVGTYAVVPAKTAGLGPGSVSADLLHRYQGSYTEDYVAVSGEVTISTAPTFEDSRAGLALALVGWLSWPDLPKQTLKCSGSVRMSPDAASTKEDADESSILGKCYCKDPSGTLSTCWPTVAGENCCGLGEAGSARREMPETAAWPCSNMCVYLAGLSDPCSANLGR